MTVCIPCNDVFAWKNEKPINSPDIIASAHFAMIYDGMRQYCWKTRYVTRYNWNQNGIANSS